MPLKGFRQVKDLIQRYRADLEEIDRRIRIFEWLAEGEKMKRTASASS